MIEKKKNRLDIHTETSDRAGALGVLEGFIRKFKTLGFALFLVSIFAMVILALGLSMAPAVYFFSMILDFTQGSGPVFKSIVLGLAIPLSYFLYGFSLIFVVPFFNYIMPFKVKPFTGNWYSIESIPWFAHNTLTYMVRFTFLDFITPTPLNILFFRMMGMKIGKGVMINTTYISDPCMITLEDYVTIGGSATLFAHYGQKGILVIKPVLIKKGVTIGLKASVMGDVEVGEGAIVPAHTVLLPKTRFPGKNEAALVPTSTSTSADVIKISSDKAS